jgi:large subunit ribosomal protein L9
VLDSLVDQGFEVEERQINMEPLKELGEYEVTVALHPEVQVPVKVVIVSEEEE